MPCDSGPGAADLWAMAAELERQFAGYKQRLAERTTTTGTTTTARDHDVDDYAVGDGAEEEDDDEAGGDGRGGSGDVRGRMYEPYVRRRDERLRDGWRARMERKEAEVKALWAQLELAAGRAGGGGCAERAAPADGDPTTTTTATATDGDDERKTERNDDDRRRSSSDVALAPRRITGKKHARTRSFSSSMTTSRNRTDVGWRRALSQERPPSELDASSGEVKKESPGGAAATTTATTRPRTSLRRRNSSVKGHGSAKQAAAGSKLPRSLPQRDSPGGPEELGRGEAPAAVQANAVAGAPPVPSRSTECAAPSGTPGASPPRMSSFSGRDEDDNSGVIGTGAANARATSPEPDRGAVDEAVPHGEPEAKNAGVEEHGEEKVDADGEVTSDSEPEPSYVYINKDAAEEQQAMALSEPSKLPGPDAALDTDVKASEETPAAPAPAEATAAAAEIATTNAEEAPARESSDESSLSVRSSGPSARPSCSSRDQSIERLLEADAALVRKKREERAEKSAAPAPRTPPGSSRFSGTARSPRETTVRGFKRFLSFGKKHRGREATVIDCTSPSVPSPADDDSGRWQSTGGSIKPRMGSSDAASDDTDHGYPVSPQACSLQSLVAASPAKSELAEIVPQQKSPKVHRSFFSFRSLNCGRG
ncbi:uncharacterized protein [Miscanthus floridulus]|uniref:uncharacterized protein isoform X2 n=1 Tax=Miscanthus floridulus TaxID=154761 RepID=UPI003457B295